MGSEAQNLHIFFFPFMAHGHMLPTIDMAKLFASRGARTAIITTPLNAPNFSNTIDRSQKLGIKIEVKTINFPPVDQSGLPQGCEHLDLVSSREMVEKFFLATSMLKEPLEQLLDECRPDCLVADMFFPWATDVAGKFGIPRLVFHGMSFFSLCASECIRLYKPHLDVSSDTDPFVIPNFPDEISLTRSQLPEHMRRGVENDFTRLLQECKESEVKSYGVIVNSFYELEPAYADYFRNVLGRRAWHIGPVSLCNRDLEDKAQRGCKKANIDEHECLNWLDTKATNSVIYVSFGSVTKFRAEQLREIAYALEDSGQDFIWVVRKLEDGTEKQDWLPEGFEERMAGKGLIIDEWAPQVLILDHRAVGTFVTHCGWNSTLEGICAGVPMVTWPVSAEQFYNEKLVVQVLKIGVGVGAQQWVSFVGDHVKRDAIEKALTRVMVGEDAESMRNRAKELAKLAREATIEGGSSYHDLNALIKQLMEDGNSGKKARNKILD